MKKNLLIISTITAAAMFSCKKDSTPVVQPPVVKSTSDIVVPAGFNWESSRNIGLTVNVSDALFPAVIHSVTVHDGDPSAGGNLLSKGSATAALPYLSKLYLSKQVTSVYVTVSFPDGSKVMQQVTVGKDDVTVTVKQ